MGFAGGRARRVGAALVFALLLTAGCAPDDPEQVVLKERAKWTVELSSWIQTDDGSLRGTFRIWGPNRSKIDTLTVKLVVAGVGGGQEEVWQSFDLTRAAGGAPTDFPLSLATSIAEVEGIGVDPVPVPGDADRAHIKELAGL
jgi:hypothetical protein